ncbi:YjeF-related protein N-terminus-domain-containing protein [Dichotomopilus funicola]|uniref:Enhancer of mRNA-decapping protein 3 n=1 Tax=Dichotomopilus funicola TaxID=1934379 RepID=A0AAN6UX08_9PEZI|nr:YjeF-related protein N-terminus-domain-containing protein [Dichotomopilus funicola]
MASEFIGLQMMVTVRGTPPIHLKGTVSAVEAGSGLTLSNVWALNTQEWKPRFTIPSEDILDLSEVTPNSVAAPSRPTPTTAPVYAPAPAPQTAQPPKPEFVDPAIVAISKPPTTTATTSSTSRAPEPHQLPNTSEKRDPGRVAIPAVQVASTSREATPTKVVTESLQGLKVEVPLAATVESVEEEAAEAVLGHEEVAGRKKKSRRQRKTGNTKAVSREDYEASPGPSTGASGRGKGWRQTPILQSTASFQPFNSLKRTRKGRPTADNGWASEDVTDVQEMGEFDFEGSLAKFDKHNLFEQMRKDDLVDEGDRLVSHNRVPRAKPGTAGGKNLHYSENVLDATQVVSKAPKERPASKETPNDFWNSEADDGLPHNEQRLSGRDQGIGSRQGSRRGEGKGAGGRRSQSRKAQDMARTSSNQTRVNSGLPTATVSQSLHLLPSNRRIETVSALQMVNLESIAQHEIGLTDEMMTENAGRGIAEVTLAALTDPAIKVRHAGSVDPNTGRAPPLTVVILAGNNKSGSRAITAARHLRNKGINVLLCLVGFEDDERHLFEDVQQQVRLYRNLGGRVFAKNDLFEHIRKISIPMLTIDTPRASLSSLTNPAPVMLIVDALLGLAIPFEELRGRDQATVYELIEWANRNEAFVMAVDVPSGVDPTSGKISVVDGNRLYVKPRYVVAVGAPKRGLLEAMIAADNYNDEAAAGGNAVPVPDDAALEWKLYLVDMGLGQAVWKKAGTKMRKGVDFDGRWVLEMRFRGITNGEGDK